MRLPFRRRHAARSQPLSTFISLLTLSSVALSPASAITFTPAPAANLDLSQLGRIALAGDFSGISLYQFEEQNERPFSTNGSESLLARMPNGAFANIVETDASIQAMCTFTMSNGTVLGVVIGGNFTSLDNMASTAVALFNPNADKDKQVIPLTGISGQVNALLCDQDTNSVYVGGNFIGANSTNAIAWVGTQGWTNLPFAGFNGPVTSITKASNGHIIFGGSFTGLGNATAPSTPDGQVINLSTAKITSGFSTTAQGFSNASDIVCKAGLGGSGNTWLLQDNTPGFWQASFRFGFQPTKLRLYNTHENGRGTKTWRFTALPLNGIMNFTYIDPATGRNASCTSECPLSNDPLVKFQDFHFVNVIGMNAFRVDISAFYGSGGGLSGIELFEDDIFAFAINDFNEPTCAGLRFPSSATPTGPWAVAPSRSSSSEYLTAQLSGSITPSSASIVFIPDIREAGNYSVNLYTPGCLQDDTCSSRGQIHISGNMTQESSKSTPIDRNIFQTNNYDKYDQIYFGLIDASSDSFRPRITMTPSPGQSLTNMTFVAQRIGFTLINSTGGLNGLYEYIPGTVVNASDFQSSAFNRLGGGFAPGSAVNALATAGDITYVAGNFTSSEARNIVAMNGRDAKDKDLDGGLNGEVESMFSNGTKLFVGGKFTSTLKNPAQVQGLSNVAVYDTEKNVWSPLGAGVNARVMRVVGLTMNITGPTPEVVISINGEFSQLEAFGNNPAVAVSGFGIWVPSQSNWLQNLNLPVEWIEGILSTSILNVPGGNSLYAGSIASSTLEARGVATLGDGLARLPVNFKGSSPSAGSGSLAKRDNTTNSTVSEGVSTGVFDTNSGRNLTILGGHFTATATNGSVIHNLLFFDGSKEEVSGIGSQITPESVFVALAVQNDVLYAGGNVTGTVNGASVSGLVSYNLGSKSFGTQPPSLNGGNGTVSSIAVRASTGDVYVGGSFKSAGSLGCPGVCFFSTSSSQWNQAGQNFDGSVNTMMWTTNTILLAGGNITINSTASTFLAKYDTDKQAWDTYPGSSQLPGPVKALTAGTKDGSQIWASGTALNGSTYLMKYDGSNWQAVGQPLQPGTDIRGLQVFSLTSSHDSTATIASNEALVITGSVVLSEFGTASAVIFNGTAFRPYALTSNSGNTAGTIARIFTERNNFFTSPGGSQLSLVFIVLIGLAISLALMLLIVLAGLFLDRLRKKREGYVPAPTHMFDRGSGIQRIPPHELLESLSKGRPGAPHV